MIFNAGMNALLHPGYLQEFPDAAWSRQTFSGFLSRRRGCSGSARNDSEGGSPSLRDIAEIGKPKALTTKDTKEVDFRKNSLTLPGRGRHQVPLLPSLRIAELRLRSE
jgi:hypothetical protein